MTTCMGTNKRYGSDCVVRRIAEIIPHPKFVIEFRKSGAMKNIRNDVALGKLDHPYSLNEYISTVPLPWKNSNVCTLGTVIGIGDDRGQYPEYDKYVQIHSKHRNEISRAAIPSDTVFFAEVELLHGHEMWGDSGGPFMCPYRETYVQYGTVSYTESSEIDGIRTHISAFEMMSKHLDFITSHVKIEQKDKRTRNFKVRKAKSASDNVNLNAYIVFVCCAIKTKTI